MPSIKGMVFFGSSVFEGGYREASNELLARLSFSTTGKCLIFKQEAIVSEKVQITILNQFEHILATLKPI
jgi:hypothetical protein